MARMQYVDTVTLAAAADGDLDALSGVQVDIYQRGTTTRAQVYTTESGGTAAANPYVTTATGLVSFWADFGKYDVRYTDTNATPRFGSFTIGWDSTPYDNLAGSVPAGVINATALRRAPVGWLLCDGSTVSRTTYSRLWDALRTDATGALTSSSPYGNGDGSTTFNLPDLRGRTAVGVDGSGGRLAADDAIGASGGTDQVTLTGAQSGVNGAGVTGQNSADHAHYTGDGRNFATNAAGGVSTSNTGGGAGVVEGVVPFTSGASQNHTHALVARNADAAHSNMQPYLITNYIIKD